MQFRNLLFTSLWLIFLGGFKISSGLRANMQKKVMLPKPIRGAENDIEFISPSLTNQAINNEINKLSNSINRDVQKLSDSIKRDLQELKDYKLYVACKKLDTNLVKNLISYGANPNAQITLETGLTGLLKTTIEILPHIKGEAMKDNKYISIVKLLNQGVKKQKKDIPLPEEFYIIDRINTQKFDSYIDSKTLEIRKEINKKMCALDQLHPYKEDAPTIEQLLSKEFTKNNSQKNKLTEPLMNEQSYKYESLIGQSEELSDDQGTLR
jgi:hypothetical protein